MIVKLLKNIKKQTDIKTLSKRKVFTLIAIGVAKKLALVAIYFFVK